MAFTVTLQIFSHWSPDLQYLHSDCSAILPPELVNFIALDKHHATHTAMTIKSDFGDVLL